MVKSPGPKHSKPRKEPVTIDLDPKEVERKPASGASSSADAPTSRTDAGAGVDSATEGDKPGTSRGDTAAGPQAKPASPSQTATSASSSTGPNTSADRSASPKAGSAPSSAAASATSSSAGSDAAGKSKPVSKEGSGSDRKSTGAAVPPSGAGGAGGPTPHPGARGAPPSAPRRGTALLAGIAGGLIALLLVAVLQWAGMWPIGTTARSSGEVAELRMQVEELRQAMAAGEPELTGDELDARIGEAVESGVAPLREEIASLQAEAADAGDEPVDLQPLQERLDALEASLAGLSDGASPETALAEVEERFSALESRLAAIEADAEANDELASRMSELEQQVAGIQSDLGERADEPRAALVIAASALKAAIDRGHGFQTELETYAALSPDAESAAALGNYAADGVPTRSAILAELSPAADRMVDAGRDRQESDDFLGNLWQSARDLVTVRPIGSVEGDSVEAIVARLEAAIREGDYGRALSEYETLPPAAQSAGADFMDGVRARHDADMIVDEALTRALRAS
jgi:hypothetical protein